MIIYLSKIFFVAGFKRAKIGAETVEGENPIIMTMAKFLECFTQQSPFNRKRSKTPANDDAPVAKSREEEKSEDEATLRVVEERSRRLGMRGRLSWTYGGGREKPGEEIDQQAVEELEAERRTERVERAVLRTSLVERRELQRGASFPGRLGGTAGGGGGGLSKEEAKRRLLSWRRTTIVRKTSEQNR